MTLPNRTLRQAQAARRCITCLLRALLGHRSESPVPGGRQRFLLCSEEGSEVVEFAITAPILFAFVFGLIQMCLAMYTYEYISELSREGARYAAVHGPTCVTSAGASCTATAASVNSYVQGLATTNIGGGTLVVNTTYPGTGGELVNNPVKVTITYAFPYHIPFVSSKTLTLTSSSQMTIVQ